MCITGISEEEEGMETIFEEIMAKMSKFDENLNHETQKGNQRKPFQGTT